MPSISRGDASRIDDLKPLFLALREHHGSVTPDWPLRNEEEAWRRRRQNYVDILDEGGVLFLATDGDDLVGFAICEQEEGGSPTWEYPRDFLAIVDIVVLPNHRGSGIGEALMREAEAEARERGLAALDLMSLAVNHAARRFYERYGFQPDLVLYRKPLD